MALQDEADKARTRQDKQNALSRALGAAFLQSQVDKLEEDMHKLEFSRGPSRGRGGRARGGSPIPPRARSPQPLLPRRLLDVSALLFALPIVKQWVRVGACQVIVSQEVLAILDDLKTSDDSHLSHLARDATRFLDAQSERNSVRLIAQKDNQQISLQALEKALESHLRLIVEQRRAILSPYVEEDIDGPSLDLCPAHLQPQLRFALWMSDASMHDKPMVVYFSSPSCSDPRASGEGVAQWTQAAGLPVLELLAADVELAREETKAFHRQQQDAGDGERDRAPTRGSSTRSRGSRGSGRGRGTPAPTHPTSGRTLFEP